MLHGLKDRRVQGRHAAVCLSLPSGHASIEYIGMTAHAHCSDQNFAAAWKLR